MSTTITGRKIEQFVAMKLSRVGYQVLSRNARTRFYEIDIIAKKHDRLHFIEVKYRKNAIFGDGLEAITDSKKKRLVKATQLWLMQNPSYQNYAISIDAVSVTKNGNKLDINLITNITE